MDPQTLILDISSDDEVGFDDSSTADNFDWISKLFEDTPVGDNDDFIINGGFFYNNNNINNDNIDESDDVVVVGEVIGKQKKQKFSSNIVVDDDDDCVVLDCDPDKPVSAETKSCGVDDDDSDELVIVGEKGQVACRDYPHSRHLCAKFPFTSTPHESLCELCHCYVCDSLAPCPYWGSGLSEVDHCHAIDKEEYWQLERKKVRQSKNPALPITKPPANNMVRVSRFPPNSARAHHALRTAATCGVSSPYGRPSIICQGRSHRPSISVARTKFQPHLVSRQLVGSCNRSTQSNKGSALISSTPVFKRSGLPLRPIGTGNYVYGSPNNAGVTEWQKLVNYVVPAKTVESTAIPTSGLPYSQPSHTLMLPSGVTSDNQYVSTSVNQYQNVSSPSILQYVSGVPNCVTPSQQPSVVTLDVPGSTFHCDTSYVPNNNTGRIQQPIEATHNLSSPSFPCHTSNSLNNFTQNCQQPLSVQGAIHQPSNSFNNAPQTLQQPSVGNLLVQGNTNSSPLDFDIDSWLSDNEPIIGAQDASYLCDMNNQPANASLDTGMLYFDFETSWKGLTHL